MLQYLQQDSEQSLLEGIRELRAFEGAQDNDYVQKSTSAFLASLETHDVIHVLFGCRTDMLGEIKVHMWMMFGTTMRMREMHQAMGADDHKAALRELGRWELLKRWGWALPAGFRILMSALRMSRKYPIDRYQKDIHRSLRELRETYRIKVGNLG